MGELGGTPKTGDVVRRGPLVEGLRDGARGADAPRILVVDDDEGVLEVCGEILAAGGYVVERASSCEEARRLLDTSRFALTVCDVRMPGETGLDLVAEIRFEHPETGILMMSGLQDPLVAEVAAEHGALGYVTKPFTEGSMLIAVSNAMRRRRSDREQEIRREELEVAVAARTKALEHANRELRRSQGMIVTSLSRALELRHRETGDHVERISGICRLIAEELGLPPAEAEALGLAASMHDVGKIGIADGILQKPGPLTPAEREDMQRHAELGHDLLSGTGVEMLELAAQIALTHHERFDGTGYPRALSGEEIPLAGRIVAVADVFDALVSDRVYRAALPLDEAVRMILNASGKHFDPRVVTAFARRLEEIKELRDRHPDPSSGDGLA